MAEKLWCAQRPAPPLDPYQATQYESGSLPIVAINANYANRTIGSKRSYASKYYSTQIFVQIKHNRALNS